MTGSQTSVGMTQGRPFEVVLGLVILMVPPSSLPQKIEGGHGISAQLAPPALAERLALHRLVPPNTGRALALAGKLPVAAAHIMLVVRRCWSLFSGLPQASQRDQQKER